MTSLWSTLLDDILTEIFVWTDPFVFLFILKFVCKKWWLLLYQSEGIWRKYATVVCPSYIFGPHENVKQRVIYYGRAYSFLLDISERRTTLGKYYADWEFAKTRKRKHGKPFFASTYLRSLKRTHLITDELRRYGFLSYDVFPTHVNFYSLCLLNMTSLAIESSPKPLFNLDETSIFRYIFNAVKEFEDKNPDSRLYSLRSIRDYYYSHGKIKVH